MAIRLAVLWCPDWPVVAAGMTADVPAAVLHANRVVARTRAAAADGVRVGCRRREAQSACPSLVLVDHEPERDRRAFEPLVRAVAELVPLVEVVEPGCLAFAARGPSRYFGGDDAMAARVLGVAAGQLARAGPAPDLGLGVADGRLAAGVAARRSVAAGVPVVVAPGGSAAALASLPVAVLADVAGLPAGLVDLLRRLGVGDLGGLARLERSDLVARFGPDGAIAHRLASGLDDLPPAAGPPPADLAVAHHLDDPVPQLHSVVFLARQLADELVSTLAGQGVVCTRLVVELETEHGEASRRVWSRPAGLSVAAVVERVRWQLEGWAAEALTGGVTLVRLVPDEVRADQGQQAGLWGGQTEADEWAARAAARVAGLLGPDAVRVPEWRGGRDPGDAFVLVPAGAVDPADRAVRAGSRGRPGEGEGPWPGRLPAPSPALLVPEPVPAELVDDGGRPVAVSGRGELSARPAAVAAGAGPRRRVQAWAGPWLLDERWWDPAQRRRQARVQVVADDGEALLLVLDGGRWWVRGRYA